MVFHCFLTALVASLSSVGASGSTLVTRRFTVVVTENCPEGETNCQDVTYVGTNRATGHDIHLKGTAVVHLCPDGVTPCHHIGYRFPNGRYVYFVGDDGSLIVTRGGKQILGQMGQWQD